MCVISRVHRKMKAMHKELKAQGERHYRQADTEKIMGIKPGTAVLQAST